MAGNGSVGPGEEIAGAPGQTSSQDGGGSSPLLPILIAIVVLAGISLGAVMYRRRRGSATGSGSSVSPETG